MTLTKVSGGILQQPIDVGIITATSIQVGSGTTIHDAGIDLGSGNLTSHNINSTGIVTSTGLDINGDGDISGDLSVSGNVSIGGTLTYEDVTNIDSVGLITARDGIIVTGGSVGIGTNNPTKKLEVAGNEVSFSPNTAGKHTHLFTTNASDDGRYLIKSDTTTVVDIQANGSSYFNGGDIGIGVTNPTSFGPTLQVAGTDPALLLQDTATAVDYFGVNVTSGITQLWYDDAAALTINTASGISGSGLAERLRITSGGAVGIGTANPSTKLHLSSGSATQLTISNTSDSMSDGATMGTIDFTAGSSNTVNARVAGAVEGTAEAGGDLVFETRTDGGSLGERLRITSDGKFGYGTATPGCFFEVSDDAAGATVQQKLINRNTAANSSTNQFIYVNNSGAGDPFTTWTVGGVTSWSMGIDNSDSDKLKIAAASNLNSNQYLTLDTSGNIGINTNGPTSKITINVDSNNQTMASYDGINISNSDTTVNNGSAVIFGFGPSSPNSFSRIGVQNKNRGSGTESQDLFFGTISNGSYAERLRIGTNGRLCLHNVTNGANSSYGRFEIQHIGTSGVDPNISYLSFHRTAHTAFQMGIVDNKFVLGVTGGAARDDVQTPHVVFDSTGTDTILGLGTTVPDGKGLDITHSRTNTYSQTADQRNLAQLIVRNGSDASNRFASLSMVSGGGTQAEGSINLVQTGNYQGNLTFKLRHGGGSTDWMERLHITSGGEITSGDLRINGFTFSNTPTGYAQFQTDNHANTFFGQNLKLGTNGTSGDNTLRIINQHAAIGGAGMYIGGNGNSNAVNRIRFYVTDANQSAGTDVTSNYHWELRPGGSTVNYSFGKYVQYYTTVQNASTYVTHVAIPMNGSTAYEIRLQNSGNGISHIRCMASHWTSNYDLIRESYLAMDAYSSVSIHDQINRTSGAQGAWSFSRPASGQTGYQSHLVINKSAGTYGGGMTGLIIIQSHRPWELHSIT